MAYTSTYLNFPRNTEEVFSFYKSVFGGEFEGGIHRFGEVPPQNGQEEIAIEDKNLVMHVCLPILGGHKLMGSDAPESMGFTVLAGNNVHISLHPDTRAEADRLFTALSEKGKVETPMSEMSWGDYYGSFADRFGVQWMINCSEKNNNTPICE